MSAMKILGGADFSSIAIAIIGAIISIISALYLSSRKINADFRLRRIELTSLYAENILKKRLELYPGAYCLLSNYIKIIRGYLTHNEVKILADAANLKQFYSAYNEWHSNNSLIFSDNAGLVSGIMRRSINDIIEKLSIEHYTGELKESDKNEVSELMQKLEVAMRIDIGILDVDEFEQKKIVLSYRDMKDSRIR